MIGCVPSSRTKLPHERSTCSWTPRSQNALIDSLRVPGIGLYVTEATPFAAVWISVLSPY